MGRFEEIRERLLKLAEEGRDIRAIIEIGSQARELEPADQFSDLDIILVTELPEKYLYGVGLVGRLGEVWISFVERNFAGAMERRLLFRGSLDVDMVVVTPEQMELAVRDSELGAILGRGYVVLFDRMGALDMLVQVPNAEAGAVMSAGDFGNMVNDFWFHTVWTAKKLKRGELYTAAMCMDGYLQRLLLRMIELHERCLHGEGYDVWHNGRLIERWAEGDVLRQLKDCFAQYDGGDIARAAAAAADLYSRLGRACAAALSYSYPEMAEGSAREILKEMLAN